MDQLRLLLVEDEEEMLRQVARSLASRLGERVQIEQELDFERALTRLSTERFDIVILDVRKGDPDSPLGGTGPEAGRTCYEEIRAHRFLPIIFHTGLPGAVEDLASATVSIVKKGGPPAELADAVDRVLSSGLPAVMRAMVAHVERVHRDYMWDFGALAWSKYGNTDPEELVHLLARRLALSFDEAGIQDLLAEIRGTEVKRETRTKLSPVRLYILPPLSSTSPRTGDLYRCPDSQELAGFWILLTPTCDLAQGKVDKPVLARCTPLTDTSEYTEWHKNRSKTKLKPLAGLLRNRREEQPERYFFLPAAFDEVPNLVVDLAAVHAVPLVELRNMTHVASLDTPFAASMLTRFLRYFGRFGTADLDTEYVLEKLASVAEGQAVRFENADE
ncbi:MAG: response regulator [Polyangiaceae bacterium]